jgi:1-acyl-sn-glycerol-3-phosphate acyltransferase
LCGTLTPARGSTGGRALSEPWFHICKAAALPPIKVWFRWRFENLDRIPRYGPAIVACNHLSYLDPLANAYAVVKAERRPRFLAKEELFRIPLVGRALRGAGQIPVRRGSVGRPPLALAEAALGRGEVVVIYPEGTVTTRPDHLPMAGKTGAVRLSLETGVPITPMASWGSAAVWQKSGRGSLKPGRPVWVGCGAPFDPRASGGDANDHDAVRSLTQGLMDHLTELTVDLRDRYPRRWSDGG